RLRRRLQGLDGRDPHRRAGPPQARRAPGGQRHHARERRRGLRLLPPPRPPDRGHAPQRLPRRAPGALHALRGAEPHPHLRGDPAMSYGTLYGVGVGPGAPDLMTLRAVAILRAAPVLVLPRSSDWGQSMAWSIAAPNVGEVPGQE